MKKIIEPLACVALLAFFFWFMYTVGTSPAYTAVSAEPVDCRYTASWEGLETEMVHHYDVLAGGWVYVPEVRTVKHPEEWGLLWRTTYADGHTEDAWKSCTPAEYDRFQHSRASQAAAG